MIAEQVAASGRPKMRLGRAAMFTVGAAMLAVAGCGDDGGEPDGGAVALYGAPPMMDAAPPAMDAAPADAEPPDGQPVALYGGPPPADASG